MRSRKLQDALGMVDPALVERADRPTARKALRGVGRAAVAALLAVALSIGALFGSGILSVQTNTPSGGGTGGGAPAILSPMKSYADFTAWKGQLQSMMEIRGVGNPFSFFLATTVPTFLLGNEGENRVYSPLNVYMALSLLAETAGGDTRQELLEVLGCNSIEALREQVSDAWSGAYLDQEYEKRLLANSLWLSKTLSCRAEAEALLAESYHASVHTGEMGSEEMNKALRQWLNEQTGGLLADYVEGLSLSPETVLALVSTVYLKSRWKQTFSEKQNITDLFHTPTGDVSCEFMRQTDTHGTYFWGEGFAATQKHLVGGGSMVFILPDEGISPEELLTHGELLSFLMAAGSYKKWENSTTVKVHLTLPKFDVSSQMDLKQGLMQLGAESCFSPSQANFSSLLGENATAYVQDVSHAARVAVDEEGVVATAYTTILEAGSALPPREEVELVFNRPFLFLITAKNGIPLFVGTVYQPVKG